MKDITGQRFGRLVAVKRTGERKNNEEIWECKCDCGNMHYVRVYSLTKGKTKSCGCLSVENGRLAGNTHGVSNGLNGGKDILGKRFSRLTVLEKTDRRSGFNIVWKCRCECGAICYVSGVKLRNGHTQSCGCKLRDTAREGATRLHESRPLIEGTNVSLISEMTLRIDNKTGVRGVHWDKSGRCYRAMITFKGKNYHLGRFADLEDAKQIRQLAEAKVFGEFLSWYNESFAGQKGAINSYRRNP